MTPRYSGRPVRPGPRRVFPVFAMIAVAIAGILLSLLLFPPN